MCTSNPNGLTALVDGREMDDRVHVDAVTQQAKDHVWTKRAALSPDARLIYDLFAGDDDELQRGCGQFPAVPRGALLTDFEMDCKDWGLVVGLAFGLEFERNPRSSQADLAERALATAREAWSAWGDPDLFTDRPFLVDRSVRPHWHWTHVMTSTD